MSSASRTQPIDSAKICSSGLSKPPCWHSAWGTRPPQHASQRVLVKIQFGGLLGLQRLQGDSTDDSAVVKNIHGLVGQAIGKQGGLDVIPCQAFVEDMTSYKLKRRR